MEREEASKRRSMSISSGKGKSRIGLKKKRLYKGRGGFDRKDQPRKLSKGGQAGGKMIVN